MRSPGITVRPLVQITGDAEFNEVFFEDVRVPKANLVGQLHQGWQVAMTTLAFERVGLGNVYQFDRLIRELTALARAPRARRPAGDRARLRSASVSRSSRSRREALRYTQYRHVTQARRVASPVPKRRSRSSSAPS